MLTASDWQYMRDMAAKIRSDRSFDIEFRRGETTLEAQEVRVEAIARGSRLQTDAAREVDQAVVVFGAPDLDVQVEDRFTLDGKLYRIVDIAINRDIDTQAAAVAVE